VVDATVEFRYSTGLTRPDYYDWPGHLRGVLGQSPRPEVVVVLFGANDMQPIMTPTGVAGVGTDGWRREYARRVDALMTDLTRGGADVYWVGQPPMRSATLSARMAMVDRIFAAQAARHPDVTFVDAWPVFASTDGGFSADLPDASGHLVRVRDDDGVHLTPAGGDLLARATLQAVSARWPLPTR
jgi:hypothetical protein